MATVTVARLKLNGQKADATVATADDGDTVATQLSTDDVLIVWDAAVITNERQLHTTVERLLGRVREGVWPVA